MDRKEKYFNYIVEDLLKSATKNVTKKNEPKTDYVIFKNGSQFSHWDVSLPYKYTFRRNPVEMINFVNYLRKSYGMRKDDMIEFWSFLVFGVNIGWDELPYDV